VPPPTRIDSTFCLVESCFQSIYVALVERFGNQFPSLEPNCNAIQFDQALSPSAEDCTALEPGGHT
jgi:hypothetical protein